MGMGIIITMDKFYTKINNEINKKIAGLGVGGSIPPDSNDINSIDDVRFRTFAERWILEFARMTQWRDNAKAGPAICKIKNYLTMQMQYFLSAVNKEADLKARRKRC